MKQLKYGENVAESNLEGFGFSFRIQYAGHNIKSIPSHYKELLFLFNGLETITDESNILCIF